MTISVDKTLKICAFASMAMLMPNFEDAHANSSKTHHNTHNQKSADSHKTVHSGHTKHQKRHHRSVNHAHVKQQRTTSNHGMYFGVNGNASLILTETTEFTQLAIPGSAWMNANDYKAMGGATTVGPVDTALTVTSSGIKLPSKKGMGFGGGVMLGMNFSGNMGMELEGAADITTKINTTDDAEDSKTTYGTFTTNTSPTVTAALSGTLAPDTGDSFKKLHDKEYVKYTAFYGLVSGVFNINFGKKLMPYVQVGGGGGYVQADFTDAVSSFTKNTVLSDAKIAGPLNAKVPAGTSLANIMKVEEKFQKKFTFMMKAGAGVTLKATDKMNISAGYAFIGSPSTIEFKGKDTDTNKLKTKVQRHAVNLGLRFNL